MAKYQNRGKTKQWRREAEQHNADAGEKHQGRKNKGGFVAGFNGAGLSSLAMGLLQRAGMKFQTAA